MTTGNPEKKKQKNNPFIVLGLQRCSICVHFCVYYVNSATTLKVNTALAFSQDHQADLVNRISSPHFQSKRENQKLVSQHIW